MDILRRKNPRLMTLNDGGVEGYLHTEYLANLCITFWQRRRRNDLYRDLFNLFRIMHGLPRRTDAKGIFQLVICWPKQTVFLRLVKVLPKVY